MGKYKHGTVIDLGKVFADVTKLGPEKGGGYKIGLIGNHGSRPDLATIDVGNRTMLKEVLSWFRE